MQRCRDAKGWKYRILLPLWGSVCRGCNAPCNSTVTDGECWVYMVACGLLADLITWLLMMGVAFMGYVLPWGLMSY
jgi:hypothetical protein